MSDNERGTLCFKTLGSGLIYDGSTALFYYLLLFEGSNHYWLDCSWRYGTSSFIVILYERELKRTSSCFPPSVRHRDGKKRQNDSQVGWIKFLKGLTENGQHPSGLGKRLL